MCYDIKSKLESQLKRAKRYNDEEWIRELEKKLSPYKEFEHFHASGFSHPKLLIYTNQKPHQPTIANWGLVPHWVRDNQQRLKFWNNTINARGESIFEKPSFKDAAKNQRCLIDLDGFFEHHHQKGKTYPYFIHRKDNELLTLAGLWSEWVDKETGELLTTFTIVTTEANALMTKIHNNPKSSRPRMPVILGEDDQENWLLADEAPKVKSLLRPFSEEKLDAFTVRRLRGKEAVGNVEEASKPFVYEELESS